MILLVAPVFAGCPIAGAGPAQQIECTADEPGLLPTLLSETGYDEPCVKTYEPRAWLWSDGADKERRVFLPDDGVIDDSDVDHWRLPVGAKLWKTFSRDGKKVETRALWQAEEGRWQGAAYVWNDDESDAVLTTGAVEDARGTAHDVPDATACASCHGGALEPIGFAAVLLANDASETSVASLLDEQRLSHTPRTLALPGDALDAQVLLGLHVNCGHCHRDGGEAEYVSMRLRLASGALDSVTSTPMYRTTIDQLAENGDGEQLRIKRGAPDQSFLAIRMAHRGDELQMPPLGTEDVDDVLLAAVRAWIARVQ